MPFTLRLINSSHRFRLFLLLMFLAVSAVLISARWKAESGKPTPATTNTQAATTSAQDTQNATQPEAELVTITPTGFEPTEITRHQGSFLFAVDNRSGLDEVELYLERETGSRLDVTLSRKRKLAWREIVDLPPGRYVLRAADYNDWRCTITVIPR